MEPGELVTYEPTVVGTVLHDTDGSHWTLGGSGLWGSEASTHWKTWDALRSCLHGKRLTLVSQPPVDDEGWKVAAPEVVTVDQVEIGDDVEITREVVPGVRASWSGRVVRREERAITLGGPGHGAHLYVRLDHGVTAPVIRRIRRTSELPAPTAVQHADTAVPRETTPQDDRPEVLAWVRGRLGCEVDWCDRMLQQAGEDPQVAEMARTIRWYRERIVTNLIGGQGCIVALFDSRRPWLNEHTEPYDPEKHGGGR